MDFIHIGPGRAGTTWIYNCLREHPEICMAKDTKETCFFDQEYNRGEEWYKSFFLHCDSSKIRGEVSNLYLYNEEVPERIYGTTPNVKLITCLRNPIERIRSVYQFRKRNGVVSGSFDEAIEENPDMISDNYYWEHLSNYLKYFDEDQLLVLFFDDLKNNPEKFLEDIYTFLGVNQTFRPDFLNEKINSSTKARFPFVGTSAKKIAKKLRKWEMYKTLDYLKWNPLIRKMILREHSRDEKENVITVEQKRALMTLFEDDIRAVMKYTDRDLSDWLDTKD